MMSENADAAPGSGLKILFEMGHCWKSRDRVLSIAEKILTSLVKPQPGSEMEF